MVGTPPLRFAGRFAALFVATYGCWVAGHWAYLAAALNKRPVEKQLIAGSFLLGLALLELLRWACKTYFPAGADPGPNRPRRR